MNKKNLIIVALVAGCLTAIILHFSAPTDEEIIKSIVMDTHDLVESEYYPTDFTKQTKLAKKLMKPLVEDVELFDDFRDPKTPALKGKSNLLRILYVALRLLEKVELNIEDLEIHIHNETMASVTLAADYTAYYRINSIADGVAPIVIDFQKIEGDWKIISARRVDVFE